MRLAVEKLLMLSSCSGDREEEDSWDDEPLDEDAFFAPRTAGCEGGRLVTLDDGAGGGSEEMRLAGECGDAVFFRGVVAGAIDPLAAAVVDDVDAELAVFDRGTTMLVDAAGTPMVPPVRATGVTRDLLVADIGSSRRASQTSKGR